jgi:acetoin utilization deacetylase AcuC-like enzyme
MRSPNNSVNSAILSAKRPGSPLRFILIETSVLKIAWSPLYQHPLPEGHRFPMEKYALIPEQLMYEGCIGPENLYEPEPISEARILLTHSEEYWQKLKTGSLTPFEIRRTGFPFSPQLVARGRVIAGGTLQNYFFARAHGVAINGAGGTHHAFADRGEGFCIFNDIAVAVNVLLAEGHIRRALVVDLDVHQGNGTAVIFEGRPEVFTFSVHCEANYPLKKERSDLDIGLPAGVEDAAYLRLLEEALPPLLDQAEPDVVFYLAGVDVLATDKLGKLRLSREGCKQRDAFVMRLCKRQGIPLVISLGGGYSPQVRDIVEAHCNTFRLAQELWF